MKPEAPTRQFSADSWRILHTVEIEMPNPPVDTMRRADLQYRLPLVLKNLGDDAPQGFKELLIEPRPVPQHSGPPRWVHGDLYSRHLVVGDDRLVRGVIDWGDTHLGDPALDLAIAWMFLSTAYRGTFKDAYGEIGISHVVSRQVPGDDAHHVLA